MFLRTCLLALTALVLAPGVAHAAKSYDNCTGFIDSLPITISAQGTWCLRNDLATGISAGPAIYIASNNVTLDCNDFKVGNLSAGTGTQAYGVFTTQAINVTVRNCRFRGFQEAVFLQAPDIAGNYRVEHNHVQGATVAGIDVRGSGSVVRGNTLTDIGGSTARSEYDAIGISAERVVDIIDNTITGLTASNVAVGVYTYHNEGGSIRGNRVRGLDSYSNQRWGISANASDRAVVRGNDIAAVGGRFGVYCSSETIRVLDNTITGFVQGVASCGDAGGNDVSP